MRKKLKFEKIKSNSDIEKNYCEYTEHEISLGRTEIKFAPNGDSSIIDVKKVSSNHSTSK